MLEFVVAVCAVPVLIVGIIILARHKPVRRARPAPAFMPSTCSICSRKVNAGEGIQINGRVYCEQECAQWAGTFTRRK